MHDLAEDMPIGQRRPLREIHLAGILLTLDRILPKLTPRMQRIKLESKRPSLRVFIVTLKDITARRVLPLVDGLLDGVRVEQF